jgi:hypothetical protein
MPVEVVTAVITGVVTNEVTSPIGGQLPPVNENNVYQGSPSQYAFTGDFASLPASFDFSLQLYVISHNQTLRPIVGQCSSFTGLPQNVTWKLQIEANDTLSLSIRNLDALGVLVSVSVPVPISQTLTITGSYDDNSGEFTLSNGTDTDTTTLVNRQPADAATPYLVLGDGTNAGINCQVSEITINQFNGVNVRWPCAEGEGLVMLDYVAQNVNAPTNGTLTSEVLHQRRA